MRKLLLALCLSILACGCSSQTSPSAQRAQLETDSRAALDALYSSSAGARALGATAKGILVFPSIVKGGFMVGGQFGEGVLFKDGYASGNYSSVSASFGLQAGLQKFGYAMFFMSDSDLKYLTSSEGWEIGVGPTVTILDKGLSESFSTTTARKGVYAFFFEQKGLMAGLGLQGTKITKIQ
ncbi:MAG: lipid-binding SYLF domain-containing protein [Deltaproteobacteria bacterium]|nr:lipid-binding SYLF domain-containing protein [Deltaproteobacteria bacterium]